jgi:hypothetical protein
MIFNHSKINKLMALSLQPRGKRFFPFDFLIDRDSEGAGYKPAPTKYPENGNAP